MLTTQPAAVRRVVGELDFRFVMKAFSRTCSQEHPWREEGGP